MPIRITDDHSSSLAMDNVNVNLLTKSSADAHYINSSGDAMTGILDMQLNKIKNIPTPVDKGDCANKDYVDIITKMIRSQTNIKLSSFSGFKLEKSLTHDDYLASVNVLVSSEIHPDQVMLFAVHPLLHYVSRGIYVTTSQSSATRDLMSNKQPPNSVQFRLVFRQPVDTETVTNLITVEGFIIIFLSNILSLTDNCNVSFLTDTPEVSD